MVHFSPVVLLLRGGNKNTFGLFLLLLSLSESPRKLINCFCLRLRNPGKHTTPVHRVEFCDWDLRHFKCFKTKTQRDRAAKGQTRKRAEKCQASLKGVVYDAVQSPSTRYFHPTRENHNCQHFFALFFVCLATVLHLLCSCEETIDDGLPTGFDDQFCLWML